MLNGETNKGEIEEKKAYRWSVKKSIKKFRKADCKSVVLVYVLYYCILLMCRNHFTVIAVQDGANSNYSENKIKHHKFSTFFMNQQQCCCCLKKGYRFLF